MKQVFVSSCVLGLVLSLSACGGGGGGGGGGGTSGSSFTFSRMTSNSESRDTPSMGSKSEAAKALTADGTDMQDDLKDKDGYKLRTGAYLRVDSDGDVRLRIDGVDVTIYESDDMRFRRKNGVDYVAMLESPRTYISGTTVAERNALWIGKLDYANFGYWAVIRDVQTGVSGARIKDTVLAETPVLFYDGKKADYRGENLSFTGIAAGIVSYSEGIDNSGVIPLVGTAKLNITGNNRGTLVLEFPSYYTFTGNVDRTRNGGGFEGEFTRVVNHSSAPVNLPKDGDDLNKFNEFAGQLYGSSRNSPTEAAGEWKLGHSDAGKGESVTVQGVFGVKK